MAQVTDCYITGGTLVVIVDGSERFEYGPPAGEAFPEPKFAGFATEFVEQCALEAVRLVESRHAKAARVPPPKARNSVTARAIGIREERP